MSKPTDDTHRSDTDRSGLRQSVQVFRSHREARAHEIAEQAKRSPYERMVQFMELQRRIWGSDNPDVRESGAVNIERRDH
jgi:alkanesulfonate monooxygenase SsuD/methylene tetrahydromethanopterin reductase-like flavin-dependent oxidoreductase (luciferase family)